MRLRRLDLTRYGKFTDHALDFGEKSGAPDLHLIYGPNEAGKSTALAAFLDLLYGIHGQTPYNFLHDYKVMQVGAALECEGAVSDWIRVKANRDSLRDGQGRPVGEHVLGPMLGGIDRDAYRAMFSLDDDTLERGGEDILKSDGDLGQLLFAASAGLSDLAQRLDDLRSKADVFRKGRTRSTELAHLKAELTALKSERDGLDTQASTYAGLVRNRDQARARFDETVRVLGDTKARADEIRRLQQGLEHAATLARLREEVAAFGDLPEPPPGWAADIGPLRDDETRLTTQRETLDRRIMALKDALGAQTVDDAGLAMADRLDRLQDAKGHYAKTMESLPNRRAERQALDGQIAALLHRLGRPAGTDPGTLVLPSATVGTLRGLIAEHGGVMARLDAAREEHGKATRALAEAQADWHQAVQATGAEAEPDPAPWEALEAAVRTARDDDAVPRLQMERETRTGLKHVLSDRLAALAPWTGDADALARLTVPDAARLADWQGGLAEADATLKDVAREIADLKAKRDRLVTEIETVRETTGVADDETANALRAARDAAWTAHRAALDAATADAFHAAMQADDEATAGRLSQTTQVARLRDAAVTLALTDSDLTHAVARRDETQARRDTLSGQVAAALVALGLPADRSPASLADWLDKRRAALDARDALRDRDDAIAALEQAAERIRAWLAAALSAAGVAAPADGALPDLLARAEAALRQHAERSSGLKAARKALKAAEREVANRTQALNTAHAAEAEWRTAWQGTLAGCWLGADGGHPTPSAIAAVLEDVDTLKAALRDRDDKDHRIAQMDQDQRAFVTDLAAILADLGEPLDPARPLEAADALRRRLVDAREADSHRRKCQEELENTRRDRAALDAPLQAVARRAAEMTALFGVESLADVAQALDRVRERAALRARIGETEAALVQGLRAPDLPTAETLLSGADPETLTREAGELEARISVLDPEKSEHFAAFRMAEKALDDVGGDDAVARLDERRRTVLLEIESGALRHLRLSLGIAAAQRALGLYRDRHRSAMLVRAAAAFTTVSRGAYTGLATQPDRDRDILVALDAGGAAKPVSALSKGTRFQLYLALRVAGYHEFASRTAPVPFIADDIMETFDDFRAEEAFRLFAGMASVGQVIYMTHHRHLCEIAREVCPTVTLHTLDGPVPPPSGA